MIEALSLLKDHAEMLGLMPCRFLLGPGAYYRFREEIGPYCALASVGPKFVSVPGIAVVDSFGPKIIFAMGIGEFAGVVYQRMKREGVALETRRL